MKRAKKVLSEHGFNLVIIILSVCSIIFPIYYQKGIFPFGGGTIMYGDMAQSVPGKVYYIWDVFHGKANAFFSWYFGLGINMSASAGGSLLSPLNVLFVFCPRESLTDYINILFVLQVICIAIAMYCYLTKYETTSVIKLIASILYALGASSLIHYQMIFIMDMAFLLPFVMMGYDRISHKKKCGLFIAALFLCFCANIYVACMVLLFLLLHTGLDLVFSKQYKTDKFECAFLIGISVVISVMISAIAILPALRLISKTSRSGSSFLGTYMGAIGASWEPRDLTFLRFMLVNLTLPMAVIINGIVIQKRNIKCFFSKIAMIVLMIIPLFVSGTELLWHGGSRNFWPVRFVFIIQFVFIDCSMYFWQYKDDKNTNERGIARLLPVFLGGLVGTYIIFSVIFRTAELNKYKIIIYLFVAGVCLTVYLLFLFGRVKNVNPVFAALIIEVSSMAYMFIAPGIYNEGGEYTMEYLKDAQIISDNLPADMNPFARVKNSDGNIPNANYAAVMGRDSIENFVHTIDASFEENLIKLGYSEDYTRLLDSGGTIFSDTILGIKYIISGSEQPAFFFDKIAECDGATGTHYNLYKNKYRAPIVVPVHYDDAELSDDRFENQNILFKSVTGVDKDLISEYNDVRYGESTVIEIKDRKAIYFYGDRSETITINVNGENLIIPKRSDANNTTYPTDANNNFICLGCFENQTVNIDFINAAGPDSIHVGIFDIDVFEEGMLNVNQDPADDMEVHRGNADVKIKLKCKEESDIFIPILYDQGWNCRINGSSERVSECFGFMKVHAQQGENEIYLKFIPEGQKEGCLMFALGIMVYLLLTFLQQREVYKKTMCIKQLSYIVLVAVFSMAIVLVYLMPMMKCIQKLIAMI